MLFRSGLRPHEQAQTIRPVQEARVLDLLVQAGRVEAEGLDEGDLLAQRLVAGGRQVRVGPEALLQDGPHVVRAVVEQETATLHPHGAQPEVGADLVATGSRRGVQTHLRVSHWLRNAAFLKLRNLEVGYQFKMARIYANATNLLTFAPFKLWDPEMGGGRGMSYPLQRTFNLGVQLTFK